MGGPLDPKEVFEGIEGEITDEQLSVAIAGTLALVSQNPIFPIWVDRVEPMADRRSFVIHTASGLRYKVGVEFLEGDDSDG